MTSKPWARVEALIDWDAASAAAKALQRKTITAYQTGRVAVDPSQKATVLVEQATSNEPWGPTGKQQANKTLLSSVFLAVVSCLIVMSAFTAA